MKQKLVKKVLEHITKHYTLSCSGLRIIKCFLLFGGFVVILPFPLHVCTLGCFSCVHVPIKKMTLISIEVNMTTHRSETIHGTNTKEDNKVLALI